MFLKTKKNIKKFCQNMVNFSVKFKVLFSLRAVSFISNKYLKVLI